ncbi:MAG TPA: MBL fold metallo-hydrolase [Streptosporangiaceae bacterium]|nr:MBL fold metallo-hydrolase [Streptosporangiaceae bacterium]
MATSPGQLLIVLVGEAADVALASDTLAGYDLDRAAFVSRNRSSLLTIIASQPTLRARLAVKYSAQLASALTRHALLDDLLAADTQTSASAARRLGADPAALARPASSPGHFTPPRASSPLRPASADARRVSQLLRRLEHARARRDQARGQLDHAQRDLRAVKAERDAAISDRDEALTNADSLRVQLGAERARSAALTRDVGHAAAVLAAALRPAPAIEPERDVRELDRQDGSAADLPIANDELGSPATAMRDLTHNLITRALADTDLDVNVLLSVLDAVALPPMPTPPRAVQTRQREMTVTPLGGGTDIGGSCLLVEAGDARILVDCGIRPKHRLSRIGPPDLEQALAGRIDAVVITHAHSDHAGFVPALVARYPSIEVLTTADTAALLPTMWHDSVKVFERAAHEHADPWELADQPPFRTPHVLAAINRVRAVPVGSVFTTTGGVTIELFPAGHILGAVGAVITAGSTRVTVTGDVSTSSQSQASVSGLVVPDAARGSDLLVIESTYCRKGNSPRTREIERFIDTVRDTVDRGGRVLVPAFALGRAQEVLLTLRNELPGMPVLVDGLAKEISRIYEQQTSSHERPLRIFNDDIRQVTPGTRREQYLAMRRGVIVTTSGMLTGGPAVIWARWLLPDPKAALLISGYQDEESAGAELLALADGSSSRFSLDGEPIEVNANVAKFALSAHADRAGLASIIADVRPDQVMLVHGLASAQREFADHLRRRGHTVVPTARCVL